MRVLLQNPLTLSYYLDSGRWTRLPHEAKAFASSQEAIELCVEQGLYDLQVVLKFPDERYDIELPVLVTRQGQNRAPRANSSAQLSP